MTVERDKQQHDRRLEPTLKLIDTYVTAVRDKNPEVADKIDPMELVRMTNEHEEHMQKITNGPSAFQLTGLDNNTSQ